MTYERVLVAVDLSAECGQVIERARSIAAAPHCIVLVHVVQPVPVTFAGESFIEPAALFEEEMQAAREGMERMLQQTGLPRGEVLAGDPKASIHRLAEEMEAEVIVVGSHGRHGLALLLGSTANGVLHGAPCDVLAVRLR